MQQQDAPLTFCHLNGCFWELFAFCDFFMENFDFAFNYIFPLLDPFMTDQVQLSAFYHLPLLLSFL